MRYGVLVMVTMMTVAGLVGAEGSDSIEDGLGEAMGCPPFFDPPPFPNKDCYCPLPVPDPYKICDLL